MADKKPPVMEEAYQLLSHDPIILRRLLRFDLPEIQGTFGRVHKDDYEDKKPPTDDLYVQMTPKDAEGRSFIDGGTFIGLARRARHGNYKIEACLLNWLIAQPQKTFVVAIAGKHGDLRYLSHMPAREVYARMLEQEKVCA